MKEVTEKALQRYVSLLSNSGFKAVFGDRKNKDVVMSVMNSFLPPHRHVTDIEYTATEHQGQLLSNKEYRYDFMCKDADGVSFIVEMQCYPNDYWFQRCVSYASRAYDRQNRKGQSYNVPPVYLIGLMDMEIPHPDKEFWKDRYISEYTFREKESHDLLDETIIIIFAELTKFRKSIAECETDTDKMLYVLKNMGNLQNRPAELQAEVYRRLFEACEISAFSKDKHAKYQEDMFDEKRLKGIEDANRRIGREEGRSEGRAEGELNSRKAIAGKLKEMGMPFAK